MSHNFGILNWAIVIVYLLAMALIGLLCAGKQKSTEEYFLAGRNMPWLVVAMSMFASLTSASTFMGLPSLAYYSNVAIFFGIILSPVIAPLIIFTFYPFYRKLGITTSYEYILHRYGQSARYAVSSLFILARLGWLGVVVYAPALALSVATGINLWLSVILMGLLATFYTTLGGLRAVLWTDVIQFIILCAGAVWIAISLGNNVNNGYAEIFSIASQAGKFDIFSLKFEWFKMTVASAAFAFFFIFMQDYGVDQITVQRLIAVKSFKGLAKAVIFNSFTDVIINALLLFIGIGLFAYYSQMHTTPPANSDAMLPYYVITVLPNGISGLIITAIFAAAMSSMDSGINSLSTVIINDFVKPLSKKQASDTHYVKLAKILTLVFGLLTIVMAWIASKHDTIIIAWNTFVSLFNGPVLAIFLLGMLTRKASFVAWVIGTIIAMAAMVYLSYFVKIHWIYNFPICFGTSFVIAFLLSNLFPAKNVDISLTIHR